MLNKKSLNNAILSWSGGKDAALTLFTLQKENQNVKSLFTTISKAHQRITMHGVPLALLRSQVKELGQNLEIIELTSDISMENYNKTMGSFFYSKFKEGIKSVVFGDIFLQDLRAYRDNELAKQNLRTLYPLWKINTLEVAQQFIKEGFKAIVVAVSSKKLDKSFAGREFDEDFLNALPQDVDPCGENGEFHTFVYDGPNFSKPVKFECGEIVYQSYESNNENESSTENWDNGFWFCELL